MTTPPTGPPGSRSRSVTERLIKPLQPTEPVATPPLRTRFPRPPGWVSPTPSTPTPEPTTPPTPTAGETISAERDAVWPIYAAILIAFAVLLFLNTQALRETVDRQPDGPLRTVLLPVTAGLHTAASKVGLDRPMAWFNYAQADRDTVPTFGGPPVPTPVPLTPGTEPTVPVAAPANPTAPAASVAPGATAINTPAAPTPTIVPPRRAVTTAAPLRTYVAGDSFVGSLAEVLAEKSTNQGLLTVVADGHPISGLSDPTYFNWPQRLQQSFAAANPPEAVVFMAGANDGVAIRTPGGTLEYGTAAWNNEYSRRAAEVMDVVGQAGGRLYYVGQPIMRDSKQNRIANDINIAIVTAAKNRPWVTYIDSWSLLTDRDGSYATFLTADNGEVVKARADDGIHLTPASTVWVANAVMRVIRKEWQLPAGQLPPLFTALGTDASEQIIFRQRRWESRFQ